ncbi:GNAT family N-acetyltransferase [Streptomyces sp. NPDC053431]|uniref:GNAT family N-acetyltransferase n=1 Tax=Streptomyces sp. NPDC053431 TaxID=3365703 RepID=UPI0037D80CA3
MSGSSAGSAREYSAPPIVHRSAAPADRERIEAIDDSFTTDRIYEVVADGAGFALRERIVDPPLVKVFPDEGEDEDDGSGGTYVEVAVAGGEVCGFVEVGVEEWHSRLVVHRIAVAPAHRGRGVGAALMERACAYGRRAGARTAWLEVTNVNAPAVRAYRRMGFELCGLDTTFYRGTASEGETALFMSRGLDTP